MAGINPNINVNQIKPARQSSLLGALPIVGGVLDSIFGNRARKRNQRLTEKRQHGYNMELANFNFDKNLEMWQMQNAYNDPTRQMERLKQAGINPHLAFSSGAGANTSGAPPQMDAQPPEAMASGVNMPFGSTLRSYQQNRLQRRQEDLLSAQTENIKAKTLTEGVVTGIKKLDTIIKSFKSSKQSELYKRSWTMQAQLMEKAQQEINNLGKSGQLIDTQTRNNMMDGLLKLDKHELNTIDKNLKQFELNFARKEGYPFTKSDPTSALILWAIEEAGGLDMLKELIQQAKSTFSPTGGATGKEYTKKTGQQSDLYLKLKKIFGQ